MNNPENTQHKPENKRSKKPFIIGGIAIFALVAAITAVLLFSPYDQNASSLKNANGSYDDIVAQLDEETEKSRLWISVANTINVNADTNVCSAIDSNGNLTSVIDNLEQNNMDIKYTFVLDDGSIIYESDLIQPGQSIEQPQLIQHLDPGSYNTTVVAQGFNVDNHAATGGTVSAQVLLQVE